MPDWIPAARDPAATPAVPKPATARPPVTIRGPAKAHAIVAPPMVATLYISMEDDECVDVSLTFVGLFKSRLVVLEGLVV